MSSQRIHRAAQSTSIFQLFDLQSGAGASSSRFYAEDGWIFREYPGKGIEIICRYDAPASAAGVMLDMATGEN